MNLENIEFLQQLPAETRELVLQLLLLAIAIIVIWALRRTITWLIIRPLRVVTGRTKNELDDLLLDAVIGPTRFLVIAGGIALTVSLLDFGDTITLVAGHLVRTFFIVALFYAIYRVFVLVSINPNTLLRFTGLTIEERLLPFMRTLISTLVIALGLVFVLQEWGYEVSGLIASLGIVGLAGALAAQDTIANMFGFTAIVSDNPFKVGDFIKTDDVMGLVEHVGVRSTRVRQLYQALVTVPNSKLTNAAILNWSRLIKRQVNFTLGVTYSTNASRMRELLVRLREMLNAREQVEPGTVIVHFLEFGDSALEILIMCNVMLPAMNDFRAEREQINLAIMEIVEELGLSIAFPTRSLYIESMPGTAVVPQRPAPAAAAPEPPPEHLAAPQKEGTSDDADQISADQIIEDED